MVNGSSSFKLIQERESNAQKHWERSTFSGRDRLKVHTANGSNNSLNGFIQKIAKHKSTNPRVLFVDKTVENVRECRINGEISPYTTDSVMQPMHTKHRRNSDGLNHRIFM